MSSVTQRRGATYSGEAAGKSGKLRCHIVCRRLAEDDQAHYSMLLCNESNAPAHVSAFVPDTAETRYRTVMETSIAPRSDLSTTVALDLEPTGAIPDIHLALTNGDIQLLFSVSNHSPDLIPFALPPVGAVASSPQSTSVRPVITEQVRSRPSPAITPVLLAFAALLMIAAVFAFRPRIVALNVPGDVRPGTTLSVAYRTLGLGTVDYTILGPDGHTIGAGPLPSGSGAFDMSLPRLAMPQTYLVRAQMSNLLGSAVRDEYVRVPAAAAEPAAAAVRAIVPRAAHVRAPVAAPMIRSFAVDRATLASGETLNVSYDVLPATGTLALVDPALQITYAKARLGPSGRASFAAPQTDTTRLLSVLLTATRGSATAQSRISVTVIARASGSPPASAAGDTIDPTASTTDDAFPLPRISAPSMVHSQQSIRIEVHGAGPGLQLVLLGSDGNEIARHQTSSGDSSMEISAPAVRAPTRIILEAMYPSSVESAPVVRTITVRP